MRKFKNFICGARLKMKSECRSEQNNMPLEEDTKIIQTACNPEIENSSQQWTFETCLDSLTHSSNVMVPFVITHISGYIKKHGLCQKNKLQDLEDTCIDEYLEKEFYESNDDSEYAFDVSSVAELKLFLEELTEPLIPISLHDMFVQNVKSRAQSSCDCMKLLKSLVNQLPSSAFYVLRCLSKLLHQFVKHGKQSGLSYASLGSTFGPIIFRMSNADPNMDIIIKKATQLLVSDYRTIFENRDENDMHQLPKNQIALPVPSTVMPVVPMEPLCVVIPPVEDLLNEESLQDKSVAVIEKQLKKLEHINLHLPEDVTAKTGIKPSIYSTRKRKEVTTDGRIIDRCSPVTESNLESCLESKSNVELKSGESKNLSDKLVENGKDICGGLNSEDYGKHAGGHSPYPPDPKRRELDSSDCTQLQLNEEVSLMSENEDLLSDWCYIRWENLPNAQSSSSNSFQVPSTSLQHENEGENSFDADSVSSWDMLFDVEAPVRSERHSIWSPFADTGADEFLSPSVHSLRKSNAYEAPLSPSAYKTYLSHRSTPLDASVPPSPPIDQEYFDRSPVKEDEVSASVKQLAKKINVLKKKIRNFDEHYESQYGYKPSHSEKMNFPEMKKPMCQLHKLRKKLKVLKEESHANPAYENWQPSRSAHILEDTTNCLKDLSKSPLKSKLPIQTAWEDVLKSLYNERKSANRPELLDEMTKSQLEDEKSAIQRALLDFESSHGKPKNAEDRSTVRPLYERYRNTKRLLVKSNSFPLSISKSLNSASLEPIMEHEAMDFSALLVEKPEFSSEEEQNAGAVNSDLDDSEFAEIPDNFSKYDNSNLHELPLHEMILQQQEAKIEKRRLRRTLKEFESDFQKINGRAFQKEDRTPANFLYSEYKLIKARVRLLEALISKRHDHNL